MCVCRESGEVVWEDPPQSAPVPDSEGMTVYQDLTRRTVSTPSSFTFILSRSGVSRSSCDVSELLGRPTQDRTSFSTHLTSRLRGRLLPGKPSHLSRSLCLGLKP